MIMFQKDWQKLEEESWEFIKDAFFWRMEDHHWRSLACVGFPRLVVTHTNDLYELDGNGMVLRKLKMYKANGVGYYVLRKKVYDPKEAKWVTHETRTTAHHLLAMLFLDRPEGSRQVRFKNKCNWEICVDNLEWK